MRNSSDLSLSAALLCCLLFGGCSDGDSGQQRNLQATRCIDAVTAAERHVFQCDGVQFKVMLTQACVDRACGLIFDVHGWLSNPDEQEGRSNLARLAGEQGGYIVVQPGELSEPSSWDAQVHNPIVADFMHQAIRAFDVDRDRVHFTGFSQGGLMTWQFVCDYPDIIASAAPLSAIEVGCFRAGDGPAREVPLFFISGTGDVLIRYYNSNTSLSVPYTLMNVMYDYGMVAVDADAYAYSPTGSLMVDASGKVDAATPGVSFEIVDGSEEANYLWTRYTNGDGTVFEHLRHTNGHVYPDNPDSEILPEEPAVWFSVGRAMLQFFMDNPRR